MKDSIWIIGYKKKVRLNNNFNSVNFHDLNFSIVQIELLNMQKQYEIVPIYLFLVHIQKSNTISSSEYHNIAHNAQCHYGECHCTECCGAIALSCSVSVRGPVLGCRVFLKSRNFFFLTINLLRSDVALLNIEVRLEQCGQIYSSHCCKFGHT